jgi:hypothetical protein
MPLGQGRAGVDPLLAYGLPASRLCHPRILLQPPMKCRKLVKGFRIARISELDLPKPVF